ncbi:MAG: DEAD/DEAH box helicase [Planctomycetes bacterium]|nr:DEAD/DEAH box helicase [Planctomycetota bacterium]
MVTCDRCPNRGDWLQVQSDGAGKWGVRGFRLKGFNAEVTSGWRPVPKGDAVAARRAILCAGCKRPLPEDVAEDLFQHKALQGTPVLFVPPEQVDLEEVVRELRRTYGDGVAAVLESDRARPAGCVPLDSLRWLAPGARKAVEHKLQTTDAASLYRHQAEAVTAIHKGGSVVLSTATSSGKSLCFQLPFLNDVAAAKGAEPPTVLYLAPLNALVDDQFRSLGDFGTAKRADGAAARFLQTVTLPGGEQFKAAQYHGGVSVEEDHPMKPATTALRRLIRKKKPDFLFTNPEMLSRAILPLAVDVTPPGCEAKRGAGAWQYLFERLRYVVLDECHEFRGVYGGHVANLIRRIKRLCARLGNKGPIRFVLCSATIRDPGRFAEALTGQAPALVIDRKRDTSERHPKKLVFLRRREATQPMREFAKGALGVVFARQRLSTIAFQESIPGVQSLYRELAKKLKKDGLPEECLRVFAATFLSDEKVEALASLRGGQVKGVISTSALALGIDIGSLSCATLITYPGTIAKAWQMLGRAGRRGPGLQLFLLGDSFLDRFWEEHPQEFIDQDKHLEELIVTPDNPHILEEHIIGANYDYPLDPKRDGAFFGDSFAQVLDVVQREDGGYLTKKKERGKEVFVFRDGTGQRLFEIALRGGSQFKVPVFLGRKDGPRVMGDDQLRALRSLHPGAVFIHNRRFYEVTKLQYDGDGPHGSGQKRFYAVVREASDREITVPVVSTEIAALEGEQRTADIGLVKARYGPISVTTQIDQFYKVPYEAERPTPSEIAVPKETVEGEEAGGAEAGESGGDGGNGPSKFRILRVFRNASTPSEHRYETEATWLEVPPEALAGMLDEEEQKRALFTAGKAIVQAIPRFHYSARDDLAFTSYETHPAADDHAAIFVYERQAGGVGLAERTFEKLSDVLHSALSEVLEGCRRCSADPTSRGCVCCVADLSDLHDRQLGIRLLRAWLDRSRHGTKRGRAKVGDADTSIKARRAPEEALRAAGFENPKTIGAGGMGRVFRARKNGRTWALKVATAGDVASEGLEQKRLREQFRHPSLLHVEDIVRSGDHVFLQMEFADGGSLAERIGAVGYAPHKSRGPNRAAAIVRELLPVVEVVSGLHERGFVHRDIKPGNLLFVGDQLKLADYGILHRRAEDDEHTHGAGTPGYAPPSQLEPKARPDVRDDVYALGVVLVELLTGRRPKRGAAPARLPGVPPKLVNIIRKAFSPRKDDRQTSAAVMLDQLREFLGTGGEDTRDVRAAAGKTARKPRR